MLSASKSSERRKRVWRRGELISRDDMSAEQIYREGVSSVLFLLKSHRIEREAAESLLSAMLSGYVNYAIDRELGESIAHLVTSAFAQYERESNV